MKARSRAVRYGEDAGERTRTSTSLRTPGPKPGAYSRFRHTRSLTTIGRQPALFASGKSKPRSSCPYDGFLMCIIDATVPTWMASGLAPSRGLGGGRGRARLEARVVSAGASSRLPAALESASRATGLRFGIAHRWAGRRGLSLIHELEDDLAAERAQRSCRALEIADTFCSSASGDWRLRYSVIQAGFAVVARSLEASPDALISLLTAIERGIADAPATVTFCTMPRARILPAEIAEAWRANRAFVDSETDALGMHVDAKIREPVVALLTAGYLTEQSCQGHLDRGCRAPWIAVQAQSPSGPRRVTQRLEELVDRFNASRTELPAWQRLIVQQPANELGPRLTFYGGCRLWDQQWSERRVLLEAMQREMAALARFIGRELCELPNYYVLAPASTSAL